MKKVSGLENRLTAVGTRCADHVTPLYPRKLALTSPTGGGRSFVIIRVRTKATEFFLGSNVVTCHLKTNSRSGRPSASRTDENIQKIRDAIMFDRRRTIDEL